MPVLDLDNQRSHQEIAAGFTADVLNANAIKVKVRLTGPRMLNCKMRGGANWVKEIAHTGDERFDLHGGYVDTTKGGIPRVMLRLMPQQRQEYHYTDVEAAQSHGFAFSVGTEWVGGFEEMFKRLLLEKDGQTGRTYGELYTAALDVEKRRLMSTQIDGHKDFGSW